MTRTLLAAGLVFVASFIAFRYLRIALLVSAVPVVLLIVLRFALALRRHRRSRTLDGLRAMTPAAFERTVGAWFARDGWLVEHRGRSGDHGIDVLAFHGDDLIAIQCKRYAEGTAVTPAQLRELYGAAVAAGATQALLVTTGRVSRAALLWAGQLPTAPPRLDVLAATDAVEMAAGRLRIEPGAAAKKLTA